MGSFKNAQSILTGACAALLVASLIPGLSVLAYGSVACGSYFAINSAWQSLSKRQVDVNLLMVLAAAGAIGVGQIVDAAILLFLFSLSSTLEAIAMAKTQSAIAGLMKLRPKEATRISGGRDERVPIESLAVGDWVRVKSFELIPVDGVIVEGEGSVDQSAMTGESVPVSKQRDDNVIGGTQNLDGMFVMCVSVPCQESTLERIVKIVENAQEHKASGEKISAWFGQRYTFFVIGAFLVSLVVRSFVGPSFHDAFAKSLTLLVALSPCALVISSPATTLSALAWAARHGILIRGGEFIERVGRIRTIAVDKTGTLTTGKPELTEICVCSTVRQGVGGGSTACKESDACWSGGHELTDEARHVLRFAAAAEQYSAHPFATAIVKAAGKWSIEVPEATSHRDVAGLGVVATVDGQEVRIGQRRFFEVDGEELNPDFASHVDEIQASGLTVAVVSYEGRLAALGLRDTPRSDARTFLDGVRAEGIERVVMVTGDNAQTAETIAKELGVSDVRAGLLPASKAEAIAEMGASGDVMMIGDGINDAPSLASASVGVAMGGLGSDIALNSADIVLMRDKLDQIPQLIRLGKATVGTIKANLFFASGMIVVLTIASLFAKLPLPVAVVGHEGSTVIVILNGLRLLNGPRLSSIAR